MPESDQAQIIARTALDQLVTEGELDASWTVDAEFSVLVQGYLASFRQLDPATGVETAEISIDFEPSDENAVESIKDRLYEWIEMSGGR